MAYIRVRNGAKGVTYQAQVRMAGMEPLARSFKTRAAAKAWVRETEAKLAKGDYSTSKAERVTLADLIDKYIKTHPAASYDQKRILKHWRAEYGRRPLGKVNTPWLTEIRDELAAGSYEVGPAGNKVAKPRKGATVNRLLANVRIVLSYAVEIGWMPAAPKVKKLPEGKRVRFLSDDELVRLRTALKACPERALYPFVMCALSSGARAGELLALEWKNLDLKKGVGLIHKSKNSEGRKLYFRGEALDALKEYAKVRVLGSPAVFTLNSGAMLLHNKYWRHFKAALAEAEIDDFRFHDLRHTAASYLAQNGATLLEIQQALGHKTAIMTQRYAHLTQSHVEAVVDRVMSAKLRFTPDEGGAR